jgi:hypothetical protein
VPFVVAVAVEGKKDAFVPALYEVWYIFFVFAAMAEFGCEFYSAFGFLMGSASCTTKLLLIWYLSGDTDCLLMRDRMICSLCWALLVPLAVDYPPW